MMHTQPVGSTCDISSDWYSSEETTLCLESTSGTNSKLWTLEWSSTQEEVTNYVFIQEGFKSPPKQTKLDIYCHI